MPQQLADLARSLEARIAANQPCWFPGLAEGLVRDFWTAEPARNRFAYSTAAWLGTQARPTLFPVPTVPALAIESLPAAFAGRFTSPALPNRDARAAEGIIKALSWLAAGGAKESTLQLIRSVHLIEARDPGYDCSHSEPTIPFSVFVSLPIDGPASSLRLAESLLHEAMHLQLSLIERRLVLVDAKAGRGYSPWQQCNRPLQGLLHGLYVFAAIHRWLTEISVDSALSAEDRGYIERRRREIAQELVQVADLERAAGLSDTGRSLAAWLLHLGASDGGRRQSGR